MSIPIYSRPPRDDELYVMKAFEKHASHCACCADPYKTHHRGSTLCAKGHARAIDVAQYVYSKDRKAYSLVDRTEHQRVRLEIPAGYGSVKGLLRAWEDGMRLLQSVKREHVRKSDSSLKYAFIKKLSGSHHHSLNNTSSDYDYSYGYDRMFGDRDLAHYYQPTKAKSSHLQPVTYRLDSSGSQVQPVIYYPR